MTDVTNQTFSTKSTRRRTTQKVKKIKETHNGNVTNGSTYRSNNDNELNRSWNVMNYSDYLEYRKRKSEESSVNTSRVSDVAEDNQDDRKSPGFIFRYYKKFGYYWNVFPKTDYCYLPGSPDYQKEISPGIPKVPNLSRYPLSSYIKRGINIGSFNQHTTAESDSRIGFSESSLLSSTKVPYSPHDDFSESELRQRDNIEGRQSLGRSFQSNFSSNVYKSESQSWRRIKVFSKTILTVIKKTTITVTAHLSTNVVSTKPDGSRSCNWLPLFLFLLLLLPLAYYFSPGFVEASQEEVVTAVSRPAGHFLSSASAYFYSAFNLVKESILYIPIIYFQLAALFTTNSSKTEALCPEPPAQDFAVPPFPLMNLSSNLTEEKLLAIQSEIVDKLSKELAGQNHHIIAWIEQMQQQLTDLTAEIKKMSSQLEGDQKNYLVKLEGELSDLRKAVVDVRDKSALGSFSIPSERMVERAVAKYHADRTGKPDYALQSAGGYVVRVKCAHTYTRTTAKFYMLGLPLPWDISNGPDTIIKPGVMPGECWAFEGSFAQVTLHLAAKVKITSFSLEHSPKELAPYGHISSAPKLFSVWALDREDDDDPAFLGRFTFLDNGENLQQFEAQEYDRAVELIELKIESNHGHPEYTCLYRFRVHGVPTTFFETRESNATQLAGKGPVPTTKSHTKPYR